MKAEMPFLPASGSVTAKVMHDVAVLARGDELLCAGQHIIVAVAARPRAQGGGVGPGLRLGQREAANPLAAGQLPQEAPLLRLGAVFDDRSAAH